MLSNIRCFRINLHVSHGQSLLSFSRVAAIVWFAFTSFIAMGHRGLAATEHHGRVQFGGVPVPGAVVTVTQGNATFTSVTDLQGSYAFLDLPDGAWTIRVNMSGFVPIDRELLSTASPTPTEWALVMLAPNEIHAEVIPAVARPIPVTASNTTVALPPETVTFANLSSEDLAQRASDGLLINGSVNNGAASPFAQLAAFGNNRRGPRPLYNGNAGIMVDNSALDARSFSLTGQDTPKPDYSRVQWTFVFGGPLKIPGLVQNGPNFFFGYQRTQNRNATIQTARMPTVQERTGDLSGLPVQIIDPTTGLPFSGNVIPQSRITPQSRALLNLYPSPNFEGPGRYNHQVPVVGVTHQDSGQFRLNQNINTRNQLSGNIDYQDTRTDAPNLFKFLDTTHTAAVSASMSWSHRFSQFLSSTIRYQYNRLATRTTPYFAGQINVSGDAGIEGNNQESLNWGPPTLFFAGGIEGLSDAQHSFNRNQTSSISYNSAWSRGRHTFNFGGDFRRQHFNVLSQQDARGTFTFTGLSGLDFADFLLGIPATSSIAFGNSDKYFRQSVYDAFFTDDWRVGPSLTLNLGVRWEYESPVIERYGRLVNLDTGLNFTTATPILSSEAATGSLIHPNKMGFQPRLAFAWRPVAGSSMIVRGGYGIYRNTSVYQPLAAQMAQQSPLSKSLSMQTTPGNPLSLANGFTAPPGINENTFAVDPDFRVGYAQNWQLSIQRDLPAALQMNVTYLGTKGNHLTQKILPNTFPEGATNPCPACPAGYVYVTSNGNSNRHTAQIQLRRRLRSGVTATAQYAYSKAIDDAGLGSAGQSTTWIAQNWRDLRAERSLSNFDQRHLLTVQGQYTLRDWTLTSQLTAGSGLPLTPIYITPVRGTGVTGTIRPDVTGVPVYSDGGIGRFLNPAAYRAPSYGSWGNAGRNSITGPSQFALDASLGRTFRSNDRINLDLRIDATNVLNHVSFPSWNTNVNSEQFGLPSRTNAMRVVQTTLRVRF
jgi:trimeric autotransporter adhesin